MDEDSYKAVLDEWDMLAEQKATEPVSDKANALAARLIGQILIGAHEHCSDFDELREIIVNNRELWKKFAAKRYETLISEGKIELC